MDNSITKRVSLNDLLRPVRRFWVMILTAVFSVVVTALVLTILSEPVYESSALLSIREHKDRVFHMPSSGLQNTFLKNQVAILQSQALASDVIRALSTSEHYDSLMIAGNAPHLNRSSLRDRVLGWMEKEEDVVQLHSFRKMVDIFMRSTSVESERETDIVTLTGRAGSPWEAALLVNTWVKVYQDYSRSDTRDELTQTKEHLQEKLTEIEAKLATSEERLRDFQKKKNVVALSKETEQLVLQLAEFETLYNQTKTEWVATGQQLTSLREQLDESKQKLVENLTDLSTPALQEMQKQMATLAAEKAAWEAQLIGAGYDSEKDTKLAQMEDRLKGITSMIVEESKKILSKDLTATNPLGRSETLITEILTLETTQKVIASKLEALQDIIDTYTGEMESLPDKNLDLARLERDVQVNSKIYIMLREKYEETVIREAGQLSICRVVDLATAPMQPVKPKPMMNLILAVFFGTMLGVGLAMGRDYFEGSIRSEDELKSMGLTIIGEVPYIRKHRRNKESHRNKRNWKIVRAKQIFPYLITHQNGNASVVEAYRAIRTAIYITNHHRECRTILLTSPGPAEGKSTTAANIAIAMAKKGNRTLLVDSDLRRPVLDMLFLGSQRSVGLTNVLGKKISWRKAVRQTAVDGLYLLSAGTHVENASELLSSSGMLRMIEEAKEEFRFVIFDSPPMLPITDATILASALDGVVLVVRTDRTTREGVQRSMELLENIQAKVMGIVVTGVNAHGLYGYDDYYSTHVESQAKEDG